MLTPIGRFPFSRFLLLAILFLLLAGGAVLWYVVSHVEAAVSQGKKSAARVGAAAVSLSRVNVASGPFQPVLTAPDFRSAASYLGDLYVAGSSGLYRFSSGELKQSWMAGHDLPSFPLVAIAVRKGIGTPELWIATDGGGVLIFDGRTFTQLLPGDKLARNVSALLPFSDGKVLIGTRDRGLYLSDGKLLQLFHPGFARTEVTALAGGEDSFWVGTRKDGAWLWQGGAAAHISDNLPDQQVLSLAVSGQRTWIGTPIGIAEYEGSGFSRRLAEGVFAQSLAVNENALWIGTVDQGTVSVPLSVQNPRPQRLLAARDGEVLRSFAALEDGSLAGVTTTSVVRLPDGDVLAAAQERSLASGHITGVLNDAHGRLWIGYFDRGLDIVDPRPGGLVHHLEDDLLFCVNRIKEDAQDGSVAVGTANGLAIFDSGATLRQVFDRRRGLIADHVTDLLFSENGGRRAMVVATPAGLSFVQNGSVSSVFAFQGLVNNHVYSLAEWNGTLYAGTLGGVSELTDGEVRSSFTSANSALRQNWITASAVFAGNLYLGTYGSGVERFEVNGTAIPFSAFDRTRVEINPGALRATTRALYAGTAGYGLAILNQDQQRWHFVTGGLPSLNVTAIDAAGGQLYVGTDNGLVRIREQDLNP